MTTKMYKSQGFSLVEIIVAVALFMIIVGGLAVLAIGGPMTSLKNQKRTQVNVFLTQSWEAVNSIRNQNWANLVNGVHGLSSSSGLWTFSASSDSYQGIIRQITVADVNRDNGGSIVSSGGTIDPDTKKITIDLKWSPTADVSQNLTVSSYLTNYVAPALWPPAPPV